MPSGENTANNRDLEKKQGGKTTNHIQATKNHEMSASEEPKQALNKFKNMKNTKILIIEDQKMKDLMWEFLQKLLVIDEGQAEGNKDGKEEKKEETKPVMLIEESKPDSDDEQSSDSSTSTIVTDQSLYNNDYAHMNPNMLANLGQPNGR